jgi:hypothetical protein
MVRKCEPARQDGVNHVAQWGPRYARLTSEIKPIARPPWHAPGQRQGAKTPGRERVLRRQAELGGAVSAGSSRTARLDPLALPARFTASDAAADGRVRHVELHRERVVLHRAVRGMRVALNLPVAMFLGVAIRAAAGEDAASDRIEIFLAHRDPALAIPLAAAADTTDIIAEWQLWGRVLALPLLVAEQDGSLRDPFPRLGAVRVKKVAPRRRRNTAIKGRHPLFLLRRRPGVTRAAPLVHRAEREIIARN